MIKETIEKTGENMRVPNLEKLQRLKEAIKNESPEKIHVLTDFDRTLTCANFKGKNLPSLIAVLRNGNYLTHDYAAKAQALFDKYHPIEIDLEIPMQEKKKAMDKWWREHYALLIKSGLNFKDLQKVVESEGVDFREGAVEFLDKLNELGIPLVIMSSGGLGGDSIKMFLEKAGRMYNNIHIISNAFIWDENGNAAGIKEPIIHSLNKDETAIMDYPVFEVIKNRKNVLLMGDNLGDVGMVEGFDYDNLIKVGFLNEKKEELLPEYEKNFDLLVLNDSDMEPVNALLRDVVGK